MAKTKNQPVGEKRRAPEWVQNIKDFFKMVFVSPFALLARIAQRIALGKEGAQKADEMAEAAYKASNERRAAEKVANHMSKEIDKILKQKNQNQEYCENPLNIKACKIYIPDNGRNDLQFAIDVHCQNQTEYNHSRDFALYVDKDGELVCNKGVPTEIVKQVEALLDQIKLTQRNTEVDTEFPQEAEQQPISTPVNITETETIPAENQPESPLDSLICTTERLTEDGYTQIDASRGDSAVTVQFKPNDTTVKILHTNAGETHTMTAEYGHHAICIAGNEPDALTAIPAADYGLLSTALHKAFEEIIEMDHSKNCPINGAICENVAQELSAISKNMTPNSNACGTHRIYIIPDTIAEKDVVMKVESTPHNFFVHTGYLNEQQIFVQREVEDGVKVSAKTQLRDVTRELAANYMYAAEYQGTPFLQGAISSNRRVTLYLGHEYDDKYYAAAIEDQHGALIVRSAAPVDYDSLSQCSYIETASLDDHQRREEALNKVADALTKSNPQHIYGIIGNVIVERNDNQLVGHMSGYPNATFTASFDDKHSIRETLETVTKHLETQMRTYENESLNIADQSENNYSELNNDDFEEVI